VKNGLAGAADCSALTSLVNSNLGGLPDLTGILAGNGSPLGGVLGLLGLSSGTTGLTGLLPDATSAVDGLLNVLNGAPLISLQGVNLSAMANAADTLANSSATTTAN